MFSGMIISTLRAAIIYVVNTSKEYSNRGSGPYYYRHAYNS